MKAAHTPSPIAVRTSGAQTVDMGEGGWLRYWPTFYAPGAASGVFSALRHSIAWEQLTSGFMTFPRLTAFVADTGIEYRYSRVLHRGTGWTPPLRDIKARVEAACGQDLNGVLLNLYRDGADSMGYHSDDETELGRNPLVASVSFGATRRFVLRHKSTKEKLRLDLTDGSLLLMGGTLQHYWQHAIPKTTQAVGERINLTFRRFQG